MNSAQHCAGADIQITLFALNGGSLPLFHRLHGAHRTVQR